MEIKTYYQSFYLKKIPIACLVEKVLDVSQTHLFGFIYVSAFLYRHNKTHSTNEEQVEGTEVSSCYTPQGNDKAFWIPIYQD